MSKSGGMGGDNNEKIVANVRNHFHTDHMTPHTQVAALEKSLQNMLTPSLTQRQSRVAVPVVTHYRNCYNTNDPRQPIAESKCREIQNTVNVHTLLSSEMKSAPTSTSMKTTCDKIMKRLKFMTAANSTHNLKSLMDAYQTNYRDVFSTCKGEVEKETHALQEISATISGNRAILRGNMSSLTKKVDILKQISKDLEEKTAQLASLRTQSSLQEHDRVRIGPASLPLGHVPARTYIIGMLVLIVALIVASIVMIMLLRNRSLDNDGMVGGEDAPSQRSSTTDVGADEGEETGLNDDTMEDSDMIDSEAVR